MSDKVTMSNYDFWCLRSAHEKLAIESGDVKEMVLCAQIRMDFITTCVSTGGREKRLPYEKHNEHMYTALRLLNEAKNAELKISKASRKKKKGEVYE